MHYHCYVETICLIEERLIGLPEQQQVAEAAKIEVSTDFVLIDKP